MNRLKQLPKVTDQVLNRLQADQTLRQRILTAASGGRSSWAVHRSRSLIPALCCLTAIVLVAIWGIRSVQHREPEPRSISFTAATHTSASPVLLQHFLQSVPMDAGHQ